MKLRGYQTEALDAVDAHEARGGQRGAVILPTGAGKTVVFTTDAARRVSRGMRGVILVHRDELVRQTVSKLHDVDPTVTTGIVQGSTNEAGCPVVVASTQTLMRGARMDAFLKFGRPDFVVVDELHHYAAASFRGVLERLGCFDGVPSVGYTATFVRSDAKRLADDWTPVYEKTVAWAIEHNHLVNLSAYAVRVPDLDLGKVSRSGGDLTDTGLGKAVQDSSAATLIPKAWKRYADGRPTILFAPTIESCDELLAGLNAADIKSEAVYGSTPTAERQAIYARFRSGVTKVIGSVGVLTEGWDEPSASCCILARPTESAGLFQQMVGRVLRKFPGKDDAILLDIVGTSEEHSLANVTDLTRDHKGDVDGSLSEATVAKCECTVPTSCCTTQGLRGECTRNKNLGLCHCGCTCPASGDRGAIKLVAGAADVEVDLFTGSDSVWLRTHGGTWFIPTKQALFTVLPVGDGMWAPARTHTAREASGPSAAWLATEPSDITTAMGKAAEAATLADPQLTAKGSKWRRAKPTDVQVELATRLGLDVAGMRKGPVSDALSVYFGSLTLDDN
jgi:superfamily II DNA or RNA helicase